MPNYRLLNNINYPSDLKKLNVEELKKLAVELRTELINAVESYKSYFMNEVLGVKLDMGNSITFKFNGSVTIAGEKINIGISPLN